MARDYFSFDLNCKNASISPNGNSSVTLTLEDVDKTDVLDLFDIPECLDYFGEDEVIGQIDNRKLEAWAEANGYVKE